MIYIISQTVVTVMYVLASDQMSEMYADMSGLLALATKVDREIYFTNIYVKSWFELRAICVIKL